MYGTIHGYLNNSNPEFLRCWGEGNSVPLMARTAEGTKHSVLKSPPSGRSHARFSRLLPALALLLGAVGLFATAPVAAQAKTFSITESARAAEGASASLTITLSEDAPGAGVAFTVAAGFSGSSTAEAADVRSIASPVTVPSGTRTLNIAIPLADDDVDEGEETFTVTIATTAAGWTKEGDGKDTAVVTIDDDDDAGVKFLGVNNSGYEEIWLHLNTPRTYRVALTSRPVADVTIKASSALGMRVSPASHTFAASSANDWKEPKEFTVTSSRIGNAGISHTVTSADRKYTSLAHADWAPSKWLQVQVQHAPTRLTLSSDRMPAEGGGVVTVTARLNGPAPMDGTTIRLTPSGTATGEGTDYTLSSTTISLLGAQSFGTATIRVTDDSVDDDGETIVLDAASTDPPLTAQRLTLTIADNDRSGTTPTGPYAALITKIEGWRNDPQLSWHKPHTDRWDQALLAFGKTVSDTSLTPMTAAQAQAFADRGWTRWVEVAEALRQIESDTRTPGPVVTVAAGNPVTEGTPASFTLTVAPAPAADLAVTVTIAQSGDVADASALGARTVTIPAATGSAAFTVATVDDGADEPDGAIVATLSAGSGYTVGDAARATVAVTDNDDAPSANPYAALIAKIEEWRNDPQLSWHKPHTDRWDQALLAFGKTVSDTSLTPMTAAQAQAFADRGWTRWVEVAEALRQVESGGTRTPGPVVTIAAGNAVTEGTPAGFTLTVAPAPATGLEVTVSDLSERRCHGFMVPWRAHGEDFGRSDVADCHSRDDE